MKGLKFILILLISILLVGCTKKHSHIYVDGKCECGEINPNYQPHTHIFVNGKCSCGESDPNYQAPHEHVFVEGICDCGVIDTNYVPDHSHVYVDGKCECGENDPNYVPPHVHEFVDGKCECGEIDPNYEEPVINYYNVTFLDMYGNVLSTQNIKEGEGAIAPTVSNLTYYSFSSWDQDFSSVTKDMTVQARYTKDKTEYLNNDYRYWVREIEQKYNVSEIIMSMDEITAYNKNIASNTSKTKVVDVLSLSKQVSSSYVTGLINSYSNINKYTIYDNNNKALSTSEKQAILDNRNLTNISSTVNVEYGLITDFAWMRTYPTNCYSNNYSMDRFQETTLNVGEEVAIYHTSSDGKWYFVQAVNYYGWVEAKYIAKCSYEEMVSFVTDNDFLVVISDYVVIENAHVRMGQKFPLISNNEEYVINFPTRTEDGKLLMKEISLQKSDSYHVGYLDYTYENLMMQAFKLLGIDYSWGDKEKDGRDCSSTQNGIYKSFGFILPRNTSNQNAIPTYGKKFSSITTSELQKYAPGTLVFSSGHVMMYIGENHQGYSYILHNTTSGNGACIIQKVNDFGINRFIGLLELQKK